METLRVTLDEADFRELISGRVVTCRGANGANDEIIEVVLNAIKLERLSIAITEAVLAAIRRGK